MTEYIETTEGTIERPTECWQSPNHWETHYSPECRKYGNGQCDGICEEGQECSCPCHREDDLPETVAEVEAWHHEFHDVIVGPFCWECEEDGNGPTPATEADDNGPLCEGCHGRRVEDGLI